jgi:hypothetical protein
MMEHSPVLLGYDRAIQEYIADRANFFGWAYSKFRQHDYYYDIGLAIQEQLTKWEPHGKAH